jgi:predicted transcriptional regulator
MKKRELKTAPLAFRVSPKIKATIDRIARADHRSTSSLIELALAQFIERETAKRRAGH